jgi:uncharacterized membrane protein YqhA
MLQRVLAGSRYLIIIAVIGTLIAATALLVYGFVETVHVVTEAASKGDVSSKGAKALALSFIELVDLFLLATVFYIVALGLYELFIDEGIPVPSWLQIHDLDDLKSKLIGVVIVVLGVLFLGQVVTWNGERDLLGFGAAIALVIGALTYFLGSRPKKNGASGGTDKTSDN